VVVRGTEIRRKILTGTDGVEGGRRATGRAAKVGHGSRRVTEDALDGFTTNFWVIRDGNCIATGSHKGRSAQPANGRQGRVAADGDAGDGMDELGK